MKIYQVGGSIRDKLRGVDNPQDIDYVVVGSNIPEMLSKGFQQVGKNFPVFIHPETKHEYALARIEFKTGFKHTDFEFIFDENVTLEQDLARRDFRCNAIAYDMESNEIIDPFNGQKDIKNKIIHHVNTEHFQEDPLRMLRMCRFAAQLNFNVAPETMGLAKHMVNQNMLQHLPAERIWKEIEKSLNYPHFYKFVETAKECGALKVLMPDIDKLWDTPEKLQYHPEGNSGEHTILTLKQAKNKNSYVKFALLLHDIGKSATPHEILPSHKGHSEAGLPLIIKTCKKLKVPNKYAKFAYTSSKYHMIRHIPKMDISQIIEIIDELENNLENFITVCHCDMTGRLRNVPQYEMNCFEKLAALLRKVYGINKKIKATDIPNYESLPKDKSFGKLYRDYRIKKISEELSSLETIV